VPTLVPHVAWWRRTHRGLWRGSPPAQSDTSVPFPQGRLPIAVDLLLFGNWLDVTGYVYQRETSAVTVTRGKSPEATRADPSVVALQLNNRDGRFSPRNPLGVYYGQIGRNTQLRVRVGNDVRGVGEVTAWPSQWDTTGTDVWVQVEASGVLRRLGQGATPLRSTLYRGLIVRTDLAAYWPCEDGADSTSIASATGGPPMAVTGAPTYATTTGIASSAALPLVSTSKWRGTVPTYTGTGVVEARMLLAPPAGGTVNGAVVARFGCTGTAVRWDVVYTTAGAGTLNLKAYDSAGALLADSGAGPVGLNGVNNYLLVRLYTSGADINYDIYTYGLGTNFATGTSGTLLANTVSRATTVDVNPNGTMVDVTVGHISVESVKTTGIVSQALQDIVNAYVGETAGARIQRLCGEEAVDFAAPDGVDLAGSVVMGAQLPGKLLDLLTECSDADLGILYEPRTFLGLAYRTRESLYNQDAAVTLDYASGDLSAFDFTDDDLNVRNDVTVTRVGGSSARAVLETGPLSVLDPPDGVGRYDTAITINVRYDTTLNDQANWRLHQGTVDELRFPRIAVQLARANFTADYAALIVPLDIGDRVDVDSPPAWMPPDTVTQLAVRFVETLTPFLRGIDMAGAPASPYVVAVADSFAVYSSDGSCLATPVDTTQTTFTVSTPSGPLWMTLADWISSGSAPFYISVGGETMLVNQDGTSGSTSPQTFTVTRSINGVVKQHLAGEAVVLALDSGPAVYAL
jgi:hypothetical protein